MLLATAQYQLVCGWQTRYSDNDNHHHHLQTTAPRCEGDHKEQEQKVVSRIWFDVWSRVYLFIGVCIKGSGLGSVFEKSVLGS